MQENWSSTLKVKERLWVLTYWGWVAELTVGDGAQDGRTNTVEVKVPEVRMRTGDSKGRLGR